MPVGTCLLIFPYPSLSLSLSVLPFCNTPFLALLMRRHLKPGAVLFGGNRAATRFEPALQTRWPPLLAADLATSTREAAASTHLL